VNRKKLSLRRPIAMVGAAVLGLAAAVALSSPASAHHPIVSGEGGCIENGQWEAVWTVVNSEDDLEGKIVKVEPAAVEGIAEGVTLPASVDGQLTGKQIVPAATTSVTLKVKVKWKRGDNIITKWAEGEAKPRKGCGQKPEAAFQPECDGSVVVTLDNSKGAHKVNLTVSAKDFTETVEVPAGETKGGIVVPPGAGEITVSKMDKVIKKYTWENPGDCGEPKGGVESTCDELIFTLENPKDGRTVTITFTPNKGEAQTLTVAPGETKQAKFAAFEGLEVKATAEGAGEEVFAWEKPDDCETPPPPPGGGGGGPELPKTGVAAGGIAGGALVLLAIGAVLFFVARRRRMRFTA
jgi:LPXTG-motif cell wall-anchored protein